MAKQSKSKQKDPYRFRPRFLGVAFLSLSFGVVLVAAGSTLAPDTFSKVLAMVSGAVGIFFGFSYLKSPIWRLSVDVRPTEVIVWNGTEERLRLPYTDVVKVILSEDRDTCYVDGGSPKLSLLIPGPGANASYDIRNKQQLIEEILGHIPEELVMSPAEAEALETPQEAEE